MEFEEIASHFGYSLGIGTIPVKRFRTQPMRRRDGKMVRKEIVIADDSIAISSRNYQKLISQIEGKTGRTHLELPDATVTETGALQRREQGPFRAGRVELHALHVAHPAVSGFDRASIAGGISIFRLVYV